MSLGPPALVALPVAPDVLAPPLRPGGLLAGPAGPLGGDDAQLLEEVDSAGQGDHLLGQYALASPEQWQHPESLAAVWQLRTSSCHV